MKVVIAGSVAGGAVAVHICRPEAAACGELLYDILAELDRKSVV